VISVHSARTRLRIGKMRIACLAPSFLTRRTTKTRSARIPRTSERIPAGWRRIRERLPRRFGASLRTGRARHLKATRLDWEGRFRRVIEAKAPWPVRASADLCQCRSPDRIADQPGCCGKPQQKVMRRLAHVSVDTKTRFPRGPSTREIESRERSTVTGPGEVITRTRSALVPMSSKSWLRRRTLLTNPGGFGWGGGGGGGGGFFSFFLFFFSPSSGGGALPSLIFLGGGGGGGRGGGALLSLPLPGGGGVVFLGGGCEGRPRRPSGTPLWLGSFFLGPAGMVPNKGIGAEMLPVSLFFRGGVWHVIASFVSKYVAKRGRHTPANNPVMRFPRKRLAFDRRRNAERIEDLLERSSMPRSAAVPASPAGNVSW